MVSERADAPEPDSSPSAEGQGLLDLTADGQDMPDLGVVDDAPTTGDAEPLEGTQIESAPPASSPAPVAQQPEVEQPQSVDPQSFNNLQEQVRVQEERLQYYNQLEQRAQVQQQVSQWEQHFEQQGYLPEQARQMAEDRASRTQEVAQMQQQAEDQRMFSLGQRNAAVHYAKQYNLGVEDLTKLERFMTPQEMEAEAKSISEVRDLKSRLAKYEQAEVPAQSFDNNQSSPSASGSEADLLDRYIAGDRSPAALEAARKYAL